MTKKKLPDKPDELDPANKTTDLSDVPPAPSSKNDPANGFDIVKFIGSIIKEEHCFRDLFTVYAANLSDKGLLYKVIYISCFVADLACILPLLFARIVAVFIIIYAFAKITGFDLFILQLFGKCPNLNICN